MKRWTTGLLATGLLLAGCASSVLSPGARDADDIQEMKSRILELQRQAAVTRVELDRLRQQVARLEQQGARPGGTAAGAERPAPAPDRPSGPGPAAPTGGDEGIEVSDLEVESVPVAGPGEPGGAAAAGQTPTAPAGVPPVAPAPAGPDPGLAPEPIDAAAQALYDRGYTLYHQGQYLEAESSFQRFLQAYPRTELSDNAQYWIGECRYARGDLEGALGAFRETHQRFPTGNKVPDALIKEGDCLQGMGDPGAARARFEEVIRRFPGSGAALMAEERLDSLR